MKYIRSGKSLIILLTIFFLNACEKEKDGSIALDSFSVGQAADLGRDSPEARDKYERILTSVLILQNPNNTYSQPKLFPSSSINLLKLFNEAKKDILNQEDFSQDFKNE